MKDIYALEKEIDILEDKLHQARRKLNLSRYEKLKKLCDEILTILRKNGLANELHKFNVRTDGPSISFPIKFDQKDIQLQLSIDVNHSNYEISVSLEKGFVDTFVLVEPIKISQPDEVIGAFRSLLKNYYSTALVLMPVLKDKIQELEENKNE